MLSLYAFLNIMGNIKKQEVGSLALEHCTAIAKDDRKNKGEESDTAFAVIYTYSI